MEVEESNNIYQRTQEESSPTVSLMIGRQNLEQAAEPAEAGKLFNSSWPQLC